MEEYEDYQLILIDNHVQLVRDLNVKDDFLDELISEFIISHNEEELILSEKTRREQNKCFLKIIMHKGPEAFEVFKRSLDENFHHLYNKLNETDFETVREKICKQNKIISKSAMDEDSNNNTGGGDNSDDDVECEVSSTQNGKQLEASSEDSEKILRQAILHLSSNDASVLRNWKRILRALDVPESEICEVEHQFRSELKECVITGLNRWIDMTGNKATMGILTSALRSQGCRRAADDIQKRFLKAK